MVTENGRNSESSTDGTRTAVNNNSVRASGSQQLVAAPCWTPPLLGQLKRDQWEGLCYLRGLSVPLRREDVYALLMGSEQGINVYSETESALYREAYEKLYGEAPPVDPTGSIGQRDAQQTELFPSVSNDSTPAETTSQEEVPSKESEESEEEGIIQGGESVQDKGKGLQRDTVPKPESKSVDPSLGKIPSGTSSLLSKNVRQSAPLGPESTNINDMLAQLVGNQGAMLESLKLLQTHTMSLGQIYESHRSDQDDINATIFSRLDSLSSGIDNMRNGVPGESTMESRLPAHTPSVGTPRKSSANDTASFAGGMAADRFVTERAQRVKASAVGKTNYTVPTQRRPGFDDWQVPRLSSVRNSGPAYKADPRLQGDPYGRTPPYEGPRFGSPLVTVGSKKAPTVVSLGSRLGNVAQENPVKSQARHNLGYRMPTRGYLASFWSLPPSWQRERPSDLPVSGGDEDLTLGQLDFVKDRVDQASAKLVSQVKKLNGGPYKGAADKRTWATVEREIIEHLNKASLNIARVHVLYMLECLDEQLNDKIMSRLGADNFLDGDQVELLYTLWNLFDEQFRSEYAPEAESDKMESLKKSVKESLPEFLYRLQSTFFSVEIETSTVMVDATKMTRMRSALPEADVQFLREHFDRDLNYDSLVTRVTEYSSNPLDRKQYETFVRNYNAIWKSDKTTGYSNADVNWVETDDNQKTVTPTAPVGDKSDKGNQMKLGGYQQSNAVSAESKNNCMRCGKSGHTSPLCTADYVMRSSRCFNCGKEGHRAAFCTVPRSSLRCKRCGQTGHVSWLCRRPWSQVISMKNSTAKDGGKPAGSEPPKPKQPVGEYTTKMVYETSAPTTETVASVAGGGNDGSQTESPTESPTEQKLSTISCEAQTIADMELEDGFLTASFEVYSPHELVKVKGLLDTSASVGFIREDFAESLVSHGAGNIVNTPSKVRVKLADGTVRYMDKAWKCFVKQISKQGHIVWKLLTFILMGGIGKPGIIIGRNQFKILGFAVTRSVLCNDEQHCVVDDEQAEKRATGHPTIPVRPVIVCQSLDPYLKATECDILRISDIFLRWRQMRGCDQPYLGIDWRGQSYLFNVLPFGLVMRSSWSTVNARKVLYSLSKQSEFESEVLSYMDDLRLLEGGGKDIILKQHALVQRFEEDGFPVAVQKTVLYNQKEAAKVFGVVWLGAEEDALKVGFQAPSVPPTTRRSVLAMLNSLYDPLGLLLELSMKGRLIMRKIAAYDWDTTLPKDLCTEAVDWVDGGLALCGVPHKCSGPSGEGPARA